MLALAALCLSATLLQPAKTDLVTAEPEWRGFGTAFPPTTVAVQGETVVMLLRRGDGSYVVAQWRRALAPLFLPLPPSAVYARDFILQFGRVPTPVAVGTFGGDPVVTLAADFGGAFSGIRERSYRWKGRWSRLSFTSSKHENIWPIPGADMRTAIGTDSLDVPTPATEDAPTPRIGSIIWRPADPSAHEVQAFSPLWARVGRALGYTQRTLDIPGSPNITGSVALRVDGNRRIEVGAGIAWSERDGIAFGDDRQAKVGAGHPGYWFNGRFVRISAELGSAFGSTGDGQIFGTLGKDGFLFDRRAKRLRRLSELVDSRGGPITPIAALGASDIVAYQLRRSDFTAHVFLLHRSKRQECP